VSRSERSTH